MAELVFNTALMTGSKSTLAMIQIYNLRQNGETVLVTTSHDRAEPGVVTSRVLTGHRLEALEVTPELDLLGYVTRAIECGASGGEPAAPTTVVCDEVQFYAPAQVVQLSRIADELGIPVHCYGLMADYREELFAASAKLIAVGAQVIRIHPGVHCWCGRPATHHALIRGGRLVRHGDPVVIGDTASVDDEYYRVLCVTHYRTGQFAREALSAS